MRNKLSIICLYDIDGKMQEHEYHYYKKEEKETMIKDFNDLREIYLHVREVWVIPTIHTRKTIENRKKDGWGIGVNGCQQIICMLEE